MAQLVLFLNWEMNLFCKIYAIFFAPLQNVQALVRYVIVFAVREDGSLALSERRKHEAIPGRMVKSYSTGFPS